jgi:lysine-N-methylase
VARNLGRPLGQQLGELREIAEQVVPANVTAAPAPWLTDRTALDWPDLLRVVFALQQTVRRGRETDTAADAGTPRLAVRLLRAINWLTLLEQAKLDRIRGPRLEELLELLRGAAEVEFPDQLNLQQIPPPTSLGRILFRLHAGQYARVDSYTAGQGSLTGRWRMFTSAIQLVVGRGDLPILHELLRPVAFTALEEPRGVIPAEAEEMLTRYFLMKLQSLHFCGRAYYHVPLVEGFRSLALVFAAVLWIARWHAAGHNRSALAVEDVVAGLTIADHHHGFSPALGSFGARSRVRTLQQLEDLPRLMAWYARS